MEYLALAHLLHTRNESEGRSDGRGSQASELAPAPRPLLVLAPCQECWPGPGRLTDLRLRRGSHTFDQLPGAALHSRRGVGRARLPPAELSGELPAAWSSPQQPRHWPTPTLASPRGTCPTREGWGRGSGRRCPKPPQERNAGRCPGRCLWLFPSTPKLPVLADLPFPVLSPSPQKQESSPLF